MTNHLKNGRMNLLRTLKNLSVSQEHPRTASDANSTSFSLSPGESLRLGATALPFFSRLPGSHMITGLSHLRGRQS